MAIIRIEIPLPAFDIVEGKRNEHEAIIKNSQSIKKPQTSKSDV